MTLLGILFLPFCIWFWRNPARLLELVLIGSVFAAAAVLVLGGYGVTPGLVPSALFVGLFLLNTVLGKRYPAEQTVLRVMLPFILVVAGALISSVVIPRLLEGDVTVWPQKISGFSVAAPLAPNSGNYTQDMYLLVDASLAISAALYTTRNGFDPRRLLDMFFVANLLVVAISLWQFCGNTVHIWFPTQFFLSNPGWALLSDETIGEVVRINAPFSEPASLASYMCGAVGAAGWMMVNGERQLLPRLVLGFGLLVILLSTSTTGYAALAMMGTMLLLYTIAAGAPAMRKRVIFGLAGAAAVTLAAMVTVPLVAPGVAHDAENVVSATFGKEQSSSYTDRTSTDRDSVNEMIKTDGLGVGWGSNRSSSLIPGLCAAVGAWGLAGLLWFAVSVARHVSAAHRAAENAAPRLVMHGCTGAVIGTLSAAVLSGPGITSPDFYLILALLIGTGARVRFEARQRRRLLRLPAPAMQPRAAQTAPGLVEG